MSCIRRVLSILLIMLMCISLGSSVSAPAMAASKTMYAKSATKIYLKKKTSSKVLANLAKADAVTVTSTKGAWSKVKFGDKTGYVKKTKLVKTAPSTAPVIRYLTSAIPLRKSAKTSAKVLAKMLKHDQVVLISTKGTWAKVQFGDKIGYTKKSKLTKTEPQQPTVEEYSTLQNGDKGEEVKKLQTRLQALGWFNGSIGGNYLALTTQAVKDFQEAANLPITGIANSETQVALYSSNAPRFSVIGVSTATPAKGKVQEMDWYKSDIQKIWARKTYCVVTDVRTGISFKVYRSGGTNHADSNPATAKDTAAMKAAYGGKWSWDRRAIWVSIGGKRYAASMNGMPHGSSAIKNNNFNGMFCIHFTNSKGHASGTVCPLHQAAIKFALAAG